MTTPNNGGPAFPVADQGTHGCYGMDLRDYFAAKAMQGICAHTDTWGKDDAGIVAAAYAIADAMLAERSKS